MTIPSPSMLHLICCVRGSKTYHPIPIYEDEDALYEDIAKAYQKAILAFYRHGCRYLQLDDTSWGEFCDLKKRSTCQARGLNPDDIEEHYVAMINRVLEGTGYQVIMHSDSDYTIQTVQSPEGNSREVSA